VPTETPARTASRVIVVGASAGGPGAIGDVLAGLPDDLDAAVVVVLHLLPDTRHHSLLAQVLGRRTTLRVSAAADGDVLLCGHVYAAPPDRHLLFDAEGAIRLVDTAPIRFHRPSIDVTMEAAASAFGANIIAVMLTGSDTDGSVGVRCVKDAGGLVLAQDGGAAYGRMPESAIASGAVDQVLPLAEIAPALVQLMVPAQ
jgi:two-component system, chemotaxis family, protein-glutamate methylesterase/glutaminase